MPISVSSVPRFELAPLRWRLRRFAQTQVKSLLARLLKAREKCPAMMPLGETLGFHVEQLDAGSAVVVMEADGRHANVLGATHGGIPFVLADTAAGLAHLGLLAEGEAGTTIEMKINFVRSVWQTKLRAEARTIHHGRTLSLLECAVFDEEGRLVARALATLIRLTEEEAQGRATIYQAGV